MGSEHSTLPPPAGAPVVPPRLGVGAAPPPPPMSAPRLHEPPPPGVSAPPSGGPQLGRQDRGKGGARVGETATRRDKPLVNVVHQRRGVPTSWAKVVISWALLGAVVIAGVKLYPRVKENLTLDSAKVTAAADGYRIADGPVSWRTPGRPRKILVHLPGEAAGLTGFRLTTDSGTLDVDVKNTVSPRSPTALQRVCDVQFEHRTATLGPPSNDQSTFDEGIYRRSATWHEGEKFVMATCLGHSHSNVLIEATSIHARWAPYAQAVETADIAS